MQSGAPRCPLLTAQPDRLTCRLAIPTATAGLYGVAVDAAGQRTGALPLLVQAGRPVVAALACDGNAPQPVGPYPAACTHTNGQGLAGFAACPPRDG